MLKPKYTAQWRGFFSEAPTSALGRQRPFAILSAQRPLLGVKRTSKTLGLRDSDFRFRPEADAVQLFWHQYE